MSCLLLGGIGFQAYNPQVLREFIDQVTQAVGQAAITRTALLFLGIAVTGQVVSALGVYTSAVVAWEATNRLRADLTRHCLRLDMRFHHTKTPGEMIQRIDGDVGVLQNFFSQFVVQMAANGVLVLVTLGFIFGEDVRAGVLLVVYVAIAFRLLLFVQKAGRESFDRVRATQGQAVGFWEEMLTAREDMKPIGAVGYIIRRNREHERAMFPEGRRSLVLFRAYTVAFAAVFVVGNALAFTVGAYLYGLGQMTLGGVFLLLAYTNLLATRVSQIANQSNDFQQAVVAIERVSELTGTTSPLQDGPEVLSVSDAPTVEFEHVSFAYTLDQFFINQGEESESSQRMYVLHDLSFHLAGGQKLGLLGRTGSGKSTIVRLIYRFYDPDSGIIRLDGGDLRQARLVELRETIGMVTQEVQLFHASVRDNLTLFNDNISDQRISAALEELGLGAWLRGLPQGLDALMMGNAADGSAGLSAGEAQLLGLARVFLQDPRLVILDEASSRLDPATEARLSRAIDRLLEGRTAVIIAHRLNTLQRVDQVLLLEDGCVVEYGPREVLAAKPESQYYRLLQLGKEEFE